MARDGIAEQGLGLSWPGLGTTVTLRVLEPASWKRAREAAMYELAAIDLACSRFRSDSELTRLNCGDGRERVVSSLLIEALELAIGAAAATNGDVDPTLGRELESIGYDRDFQLLGSASSYTSTPTVVARRRSRWRSVEIDHARSAVSIPRGTKLDLGATAKAWAADRAAAAAHASAECGVLISVGGDIATAGEPPSGGWLVRVTDDHRSGTSAPGQTITIASGGLATSTTAVRRWTHDGSSMHHLLDPRTGLPATEIWRTASAAAATCADANTATTAALVRGEAAPRWLAELGVPARLVAADGSVTYVGAWPMPEGNTEPPARARATVPALGAP